MAMLGFEVNYFGGEKMTTLGFYFRLGFFLLAVLAFFSCGRGSRNLQIDFPRAYDENEITTAQGEASFPTALPVDRVQPWEELDENGYVIPARLGAHGSSIYAKPGAHDSSIHAKPGAHDILVVGNSADRDVRPPGKQETRSWRRDSPVPQYSSADRNVRPPVSGEEQKKGTSAINLQTDFTPALRGSTKVET